MSKATHTPGPLMVGPRKHHVINANVEGGMRHSVATTRGPHAAEYALLFAAAPEMLSALELVQDHAGIGGDIQRRIKAVIAKARGQSEGEQS